MNDTQIWEACNLVFKTYSLIKLPALKMCFDRAKTGRYGTSYDRVDVQVICEWISEYLKEEANEISRLHEEKAGEHKRIASQPFHESFKPVLESVIAKSEVIQDEIKKDDQSVLFNKFYRQFDKLYKNYSVGSGSIRFIKRYGKVLDGLAYCEYKFEQMKRVNQRFGIKK